LASALLASPPLTSPRLASPPPGRGAISSSASSPSASPESGFTRFAPTPRRRDRVRRDLDHRFPRRTSVVPSPHAPFSMPPSGGGELHSRPPPGLSNSRIAEGRRANGASGTAPLSAALS